MTTNELKYDIAELRVIIQELTRRLKIVESEGEQVRQAFRTLAVGIESLKRKLM